MTITTSRRAVLIGTAAMLAPVARAATVMAGGKEYREMRVLPGPVTLEAAQIMCDKRP